MSAEFRTYLMCFIFAFASGACTKQHNPYPDINKQLAESATANRPVRPLADDGNVPAVQAESAPQGPYEKFCASCHGVGGAGDGAGAAALNPKPRDFTDKAWQAQVDDARIKTVIEKGGPAVGLSNLMAPWGSVLSPDELNELVAKIRAFGQ